ncbi:sugar porter family MFS transporter [Aspergillus ruber CBS 135680]|uniref:General substrate transporter n=1 Tax=Aspergillus ruber (strain CBS 135680) TaxID=1388766 RepID=A0A017SCK1_ASPRC|nr:general substrate transporter [Aspergillus ruber CBS 135680]EYE94652.1 general substrate transporter [Aspergillus ruber CBS 135680]
MTRSYTLSQPYFGLKGGWLTFWVTVACATDMMLFGYDQGVFAGVIVTKDFLNVHGLNNNESLIGTVTALYDVGCFFGAIGAMWLGERLGRKKSILTGTSIMTIGAILQIASYSVPQMIVGRVVAGIGNGINTSTAPVWQGETSQIKWRGKLVIIELVMNVAGYSLSNWMTFAFSFVPGPASWRFPLAFQIVFIIVLYATVPWLPESPRWLISCDRDQANEAQQIIADLEGKDINDPYIITAYSEIIATVEYERAHDVSWGQLLRGKTGENNGDTQPLRRMILGAGAQAMQQLAGINVTSYYLPTVLMQSVGLSEMLARLLAACNSVSYLLASMVAIPKIEHWGRRSILMFAALGQGTCYLLITVLLRFNEKENYPHHREVASAAVAFFFAYYVFFGCSYQGIGWLLPVELNSLSMRTKGAALGTATNWATNFMVVEVTPVGIKNLGWKFYIIWTVFNFAFIPTVYFFYPETANRSLEDIDRFFHENSSLFVNGNPEAVNIKRPARYVEIEKELVNQSATVASAKQEMSGLEGQAGHVEVV